MQALSALILAIFFTILTIQSANADLVLSAPPRENATAGESYYGPIAKKLSILLNEQVVYQHPNNWTAYAKNMRAGKYDIVFDGPHFVAWRIKHLGHVPVARLSGNLQFYVLAKKTDTEIQTMQDLLGSGLCGLASPNLATLSAYNLYSNPIVQPEIRSIKGGMKHLVKLFLDDKCRAVIVPDRSYNKLSKQNKALIKIVAKSRKMPNQTISLSNKINKTNRDKIEKFLHSHNGFIAADGLFQRFSKNNKQFVKPKENEYAGLEDLLEGVVYGW